MYEILENAFHTIVMYSCLLLEGIGIAIILYMAIRSLVLLIRGRKGVGMGLAKGIALALEFLLGGEVLHTIIAEDLQQLLVVGIIVVLRVTLTVLIHWEIKTEKAEEKEA
ncbi:MAG: DUF1622 domain-containing protein [Clostridia bacterium]|nr:DUF1622 domain-containing protein [Clostridia bacterium]